MSKYSDKYAKAIDNLITILIAGGGFYGMYVLVEMVARYQQ